MKIKIKINKRLEGYDLIDLDSNQSHDGDGACEIIATVYAAPNASLIALLLNTHTEQFGG